MSERDPHANDDALEAAITTALDEPGAVVIGWCLVAAYKSPEQTMETGYFHANPKGQPYHSTLGLWHVGLDYLKESVDE